MNFIRSIEEKLNNLGFRKLNDNELIEIYNEISKAVEIGLERRALPTEADGGVLAIPTKSDFINFSQWNDIEEGKLVIVCNYGGTNWVTGVRRKKGNLFEKVGNDRMVSFVPENRKYAFYEFVGLMKREICSIDQHLLNEAEVIGIALGFAQKPEWVSHGLDARLIPASMTKHWEITDMRNLPATSLIGENLLERLNLIYPQISKIYIRNDAEAIGSDIKTGEIHHLPITIVAGTGLGMVVTRKWDSQNINLEIGRAKIKIDTFNVMEHMYAADDLPDRTNILEYHIGGDYIKSKVFHGLKFLSNIQDINQLTELFNNDQMGDLISRLAKKEEIGLNTNDLVYASHISKAALEQAGQIIACAFCAVVNTAGYGEEFTDKSKEVCVATDGSIIHKAYLVQSEFKKTIFKFLSTEKLITFDADGLDGIGKFALVKNHLQHSACI